MSAKVFNGFRIRSSDFSEISDLCEEFTKTLSKIRITKQSELIAIAACNLFDRAPNTPRLFHVAAGSILDRQREITKTQQRDPRVDLEFNLALWSTGDDTLGNIRCEQDDWIALWLQSPLVERYFYYDHTDRPDDLSEEEWNRREQDWEFASKQPCFQTSLETHVRILTPEDIIPFIPDRKFRALSQAKQRVLAEMFAERSAAGQGADTVERSMMRLMGDITKPEGVARVDALALEIEPTLVEITAELLSADK